MKRGLEVGRKCDSGDVAGSGRRLSLGGVRVGWGWYENAGSDPKRTFLPGNLFGQIISVSC
jgi:hypothetical protein